MLSEEDVARLREWFREKERADLSSQYRHQYISPPYVASARLLQGALLAGAVEPGLAADILGEFAKDESGREKLKEYVDLVIDKGYVTSAGRRLSDAIKRVLLIDDQYEKNGWEKVLGAIFSRKSGEGTKLHCASTINESLSYLEELRGIDPRVADLLLRDERP